MPFSATTAFADVASTGAKIFERACLNQEALKLNSGATFKEGLKAANTAQVQFTKLASKAQKAGLVGRPEYRFSPDKNTGLYTCHVTSKDLTADEITVHFGSLSRKASRAFGEPEYSKAAVDGAPEMRAEGLRSTFESNGILVVLEAIYFVSDHGPVGAYVISIDHDVE